MRLSPFELTEPASLAEACAALAEAGDGGRLVAGGTALVPMMRLGLVRPERVIALHRVAGLDGIAAVDGGLDLGAMVTMARLARAPAVVSGWPLLAEAARRVATPAIRSAATLGGNLGYAESASDPAPALLCLDADVRIAGTRGERSVPLARFFTGFYETALGDGEIVAGVRVPAVPAGAVGGYVKFCSRSAEDKPLIGVAALLVVDRARGASGGRGSPSPGRRPRRSGARRAEAALEAAELSDAAIRVGGGDGRGASPIRTPT